MKKKKKKHSKSKADKAKHGLRRRAKISHFFGIEARVSGGEKEKERKEEEKKKRGKKKRLRRRRNPGMETIRVWNSCLEIWNFGLEIVWITFMEIP